jgi:plastocyanin
MAAVLAGVLIAFAGISRSRQEKPIYIVSQKGREFHPNVLTIRRGESIRIINDDGDLSHHAYVKTREFSFDSGDQLPGSKTDVVFPVAGTFNVLCGIHPKMRLVINVK